MGVKGNNLAPIKIDLGCQEGPGLKLTGSCFIKYCTLFCIEPAHFLHGHGIFSSSNVNLKARCHSIFICSCFVYIFFNFVMIKRSYCI